MIRTVSLPPLPNIVDSPSRVILYSNNQQEFIYSPNSSDASPDWYVVPASAVEQFIMDYHKPKESTWDKFTKKVRGLFR